MIIDLNCDMGESFGRYTLGNDLEIMPYITSCNIACGFHGGDPKIIIETIKNAHKHGLKIGAHPSFPDLQGFGRRKMTMERNELTATLQYQIAVLDKLSQIHANGLHHVKPHGALYNLAYSDADTAWAILEAMSPWKERVILFAQYNSLLAKVGKSEGYKIMLEGFVDRKYNNDLSLVSRSKPDAVHKDIGTMVDQIIDMVKNRKITTSEKIESISVQTVCVHGDHPQAVEIAKSLSVALENEGISIQ